MPESEEERLGMSMLMDLFTSEGAVVEISEGFKMLVEIDMEKVVEGMGHFKVYLNTFPTIEEIERNKTVLNSAIRAITTLLERNLREFLKEIK